MRTPSSFRCVAPVVALFAVNCAVEESVEPDAGSGDRSDAYNGEPIFEQLLENDPNWVCCCAQREDQCSNVVLGGRRDCRASPESCGLLQHDRVEPDNRRDVIVDGCPVWEIIDHDLTWCPPDQGANPPDDTDSGLQSDVELDGSAAGDGSADSNGSGGPEPGE
jgi:hypothetical protein